jgi:small-conductance mechanosensitive channel
MEGLDDERRPVADPAALERRMLERWLLFLFLAVVVLVFLGTLVGALATSLGFGSA